METGDLHGMKVTAIYVFINPAIGLYLNYTSSGDLEGRRAICRSIDIESASL